MSGELSEVENNEIEVATPESVLPVVANPFAENAAGLITGSFLPRLQLEGSNSERVKFNKINKGHWAFIHGRENFIDLGKEVDILVLDYRTKALDTTDTDKIVVSYDFKSPEFQRIKNATGRGYNWGLEWLVWVPSVDFPTKFATLFMGSKTARQAAKNFARYDKPDLRLSERVATLSHEILKNKDYVWEGQVIIHNSTGLSSYPSIADIQKYREDFLNPKPQTPAEPVEEAEVGEERDR